MSAFLEVRARAKAAGIGDDVVIAFQKFDTDASGDIDVEELRYALEAAGLGAAAQYGKMSVNQTRNYGAVKRILQNLSFFNI